MILSPEGVIPLEVEVHGNRIITPDFTFTILLSQPMSQNGTSSPFEPKRELAAPQTSEAVTLLDNKETALRFDGQDWFIENKVVSLSLLNPLEEKILKFLYQNANRTCSYYKIAQHVWGGSIAKNSIDTLISRLRRKLNQISPHSGKRFIKDIHGYGYRMTLD